MTRLTRLARVNCRVSVLWRAMAAIAGLLVLGEIGLTQVDGLRVVGTGQVTVSQATTLQKDGPGTGLDTPVAPRLVGIGVVPAAELPVSDKASPSSEQGTPPVAAEAGSIPPNQLPIYEKFIPAAERGATEPPQAAESGLVPSNEQAPSVKSMPAPDRDAAVSPQAGESGAVLFGELPPNDKATGPDATASSATPEVVGAGQVPIDELPVFDKPAESGDVGPGGAGEEADGGGERAGQCLGGGCTEVGTNYPSGTFSTTSSSWTVVATNIYAGEYANYSVTSGKTYEWSLCVADGGSASYDSQLTLSNVGNTTRYCYSDDYCGDDGAISWTATFTGTVRVMVNQFSCVTNSINTTLVWRCTNCDLPDTVCCYDAWWTNPVDVNGDGYKRSARLNWDADVCDCSGTLTVYAKVYWKLCSSGTWNLLTTTGNYTITNCLTSDAYYLDINGGNHDCYDWRIELYRAGQSSPDCMRDPSNDADLNDYLMETAVQDVVDTVCCYDAWWTNPVDVNGDGYKRSARLNWDADVCDCSGTLTVYAKVYWKLCSSGTWNLLTTTGNYTITNCLTSDAYYVDINGGNHDCYDWKIELYRAGQSSPDCMRDPSNDSDLNDYLMETAAQDVPDTVCCFDAWWSNPVDEDGDGYKSAARLNWDADVCDCNGTLTVYAKVYWKLCSSGTWNLLTTTGNYSITNCLTSDAYYVDINGGDHNCYDWMIELYRAGQSSPDCMRDPSSDSDLNDYLMETAAQERACCYDAWWSNPVDMDGDGYKRSARLNWDIDVCGCSGTLSVYAKVYWKLCSNSTWTLLITTGNYPITNCATTDSFYVDINGGDHNCYDWMIELYRAGQSSPDCARDPSSDSDLNDYLMETAAQDPEPVPDTVCCYGAWWSNAVDNDGDGYKSLARLNWDADVCDCSGTLTVYTNVYWKLCSDSTWNLLATTTNYAITDCATTDSYYMDIGGGDHNCYDWRIELYRAGQSSPDCALDPSNDSDLNDYLMETAGQDVSAADIRVEPTSLSVTCGALAAAPTYGDPGLSYEALIVPSDPRRAADLIARLQPHGVRVLTDLNGRILWCRVPGGVALDDLVGPDGIVAHDGASAQALLASGDSLVAAVAAEFVRAVDVGREVGAPLDLAHPLIDDAWDSGISGGRDGNTGDMTGSVEVAIIFVESDGSIDPNTYTWTTADEDSTLAGVNTGLAWWAARAADNGCSVSFSVEAYRHTDARVQQGYEPVTRSSGDASLWVSAVMDNFGYSSGDHIARVSAFNTWLRTNFGTTRSYTAFVCYNPSPAPDRYTDGYAAWAIGPYTNLLFRSFGWAFSQVFTHESGHIFTACDEYYQAGYGGCTSCGLCSHGVDNANCEFCNPNAVECMMRANSWTLCDFTPGHLGWENCSGSDCFTIYNDGSGTLQVTSITKPSWATLSPPPPYSIAGGANQPVCVQVDCGACSGSDLDSILVINSDDPDEPTVNVSVHVDCPALTGACCYSNYTCTITTQVNCTGNWLGAGTTCNQCPQPPTGACCYSNYTCTITTQANCTGNWLGAGTTCNQCPQAPTGACCYPDYSCVITTQANCTYTWLGPGTTCNQCPQATGVCCYVGGGCGVTTQAACTGVWHGEWTSCDPNPCVQTVCRGDANCDGGISWRDIDFFVAAMSGEQAWRDMFLPGAPTCLYANNDVNNDGAVSWRDIDPFVALMGTDCP